MRCLQCGVKLPWVLRLKNSKFCSTKHQLLYRDTQDRTAFAELNTRKSAAKPSAAIEAGAGVYELDEGEALGVGTAVSEAPPEYEVLNRELATETVEGKPLAREPDSERLSTDLTAIGHAAAGTVGETAGESGGDNVMAERYARFLSMVDAERHYYQDLLDRLPAGVAVIGEDLRVVYSNRPFRRLQEDDGDAAERLGVTSTEVRDAIRNLLSAASNGRESAPVRFDDESRSIRVEPIAVLANEESGVKGVLVFTSPAGSKELARND